MGLGYRSNAGLFSAQMCYASVKSL